MDEMSLYIDAHFEDHLRQLDKLAYDKLIIKTMRARSRLFEDKKFFEGKREQDKLETILQIYRERFTANETQK